MSHLLPTKLFHRVAPSIFISKPPAVNKIEATEIVQKLDENIKDLNPFMTQSQLAAEGYFFDDDKPTVRESDLQFAKEEGWEVVDHQEATTGATYKDKALQSSHLEMTASLPITIDIQEASVTEHSATLSNSTFQGYLRSAIPVHYPPSVQTSKGFFPRVGAQMDFRTSMVNESGLMPGGVYLSI